ncbi:hypothetical protein LOTGIDRAFT_228076 [Lottia gigantea]|uniref:Uncharacterized protein n=1 Tax=Lottia gigantea TaxID=225164 RepID=V4BI01_LOTGI|nr:hypothetical protein LOTGIDRAFT_228076 [Lottia gigantea]ESP05532.1 hypothetical protein LOTGIDRAFT_228076 [Lottia gigantea]
MANNSQISNGSGDDVIDNCNNDFPYSDFYLEHLNVVEKVFIAAGGVLTLITLCIFLYELRWIWFTRHYNNVLYIIIWLLGLYPMASFCSMIATLAPRTVLFCEFVAAAYLGICLYKFVGLIVTYYGGLDQMVVKKTGSVIALRSPPLACCCCCCPSVEPTKQNLVRMQYLVLQCAMVKPPLMFIATILWTENLYSKSIFLEKHRSLREKINH